MSMADWKMDRTNRFYDSLIDSISNKPKIGIDYYPISSHDDLMDSIQKQQANGNDCRLFSTDRGIVDLDNLLVWDHKQSEPIAKVTSCEMVGGPGSRASLRVEAIALTKEEKEKMVKYSKCSGQSRFGIKRVIFSDPATIVFWEDGTKTVVKAHNEDFDPEKGLAMAVCKRVYGDKYHRVFKDYIPKEKPEEIENYENAFKVAADAIKELTKELNAGKENK